MFCLIAIDLSLLRVGHNNDVQVIVALATYLL